MEIIIGRCSPCGRGARKLENVFGSFSTESTSACLKTPHTCPTASKCTGDVLRNSSQIAWASSAYQRPSSRFRPSITQRLLRHQGLTSSSFLSFVHPDARQSEVVAIRPPSLSLPP